MASGKDRDGGRGRGEQRAGELDQRESAESAVGEVLSARLRNRQKVPQRRLPHFGGLSILPRRRGP